jgi:hypothetical protein
MSNALAIAAVTETLVQFLHDQIVVPSQLGSAWVSSVSPDNANALPNPGVNVFLYQVTPNLANRNIDLPTRSADGKTLLRKPVVALDLHYLLTFHGDDTALEPQRLLGATVLALHRQPVMQRSDVKPAPLASVAAQTDKIGAAADSGLAVQSQLIRFTPVTYTLEELSKLWSFLLKIDYVLSVAYVASVVLIESDDQPAPSGPPALGYQVQVMPFPQTTIRGIVSAAGAGSPIAAASRIAISGAALLPSGGGSLTVLFNGSEGTAPDPVPPPTAGQIFATLPPDLKAGPNTVQIIQPLALGSPPTPHPGTGPASNAFPFVLTPTVAAGSIAVVGVQGSPPGQTLQLGVVPPAQTGQRALLLLTGGSPATTRPIDGGTVAATTSNLSFALPLLPPGSYAVQVMIDGARSPLGVSGPTVDL